MTSWLSVPWLPSPRLETRVIPTQFPAPAQRALAKGLGRLAGSPSRHTGVPPPVHRGGIEAQRGEATGSRHGTGRRDVTRSPGRVHGQGLDTLLWRDAGGGSSWRAKPSLSCPVLWSTLPAVSSVSPSVTVSPPWGSGCHYRHSMRTKTNSSRQTTHTRYFQNKHAARGFNFAPQASVRNQRRGFSLCILI